MSGNADHLLVKRSRLKGRTALGFIRESLEKKQAIPQTTLLMKFFGVSQSTDDFPRNQGIPLVLEVTSELWLRDRSGASD